MKTTTNLMGALAVALALAGASQATAALSYTASNGGDLLSGFKVSVDGMSQYNILVGGVEMSASNPQSGVPGFLNFTTVCLDVAGRLNLGVAYNYNEVGFSGQIGLDPNWGNPESSPHNTAAAYQAINNAAYIFENHQNLSTPTDWAALQLAVWKALYDTTMTGTIVMGDGSRFSVQKDPTGTAWNEALAWLNALPRTQNFSGNMLQPTDPSAQEFIFLSASAVPEPTTLAAGALLLVPFALSTVRFLRRRPGA